MGVREGKFVPTFAAGVLVVQGDELLAVSRQPPRGTGQVYDWGLPGGKAEPIETPYMTAQRELLEETGLYAHGLEPLITVPAEIAGGMPFHVYRPVTVVTGKLKTTTREGRVRWLNLETFLRMHDPEVSVRESNRFILYWGLGLIV